MDKYQELPKKFIERYKSLFKSNFQLGEPLNIIIGNTVIKNNIKYDIKFSIIKSQKDKKYCHSCGSKLPNKTEIEERDKQFYFGVIYGTIITILIMGGAVFLPKYAIIIVGLLIFILYNYREVISIYNRGKDNNRKKMKRNVEKKLEH